MDAQKCNYVMLGVCVNRSGHLCGANANKVDDDQVFTKEDCFEV
jgi:hypothetical protein